jgi:hypothetical protein
MQILSFARCRRCKANSCKTMSKNLERSESSSLSFLMDIQGIDRLALLSVAGHLGYNYSENRQFKNEYLEIQSKMITLKEMAENVAFADTVQARIDDGRAFHLLGSRT